MHTRGRVLSARGESWTEQECPTGIAGGCCRDEVEVAVAVEVGGHDGARARDARGDEAILNALRGVEEEEGQ